MIRLHALLAAATLTVTSLVASGCDRRCGDDDEDRRRRPHAVAEAPRLRGSPSSTNPSLAERAASPSHSAARAPQSRQAGALRPCEGGAQAADVRPRR